MGENTLLLQRRKKTVIESTFELMRQENDMDKLTVDEIVAAAPVGKTTLFSYFGSKEALYGEVYTYFMNKIDEASEKILEQNLSFSDTLEGLTRCKLEQIAQVSEGFFRGFMHYFSQQSKENSRMRSFAQKSVQDLLKVFHRGKIEGVVDESFSDEFLVLYFNTLIEGISSPRIYEKVLPYVHDLTKMMIRGFAPDIK